MYRLYILEDYIELIFKFSRNSEKYSVFVIDKNIISNIKCVIHNFRLKILM